MDHPTAVKELLAELEEAARGRTLGERYTAATVTVGVAEIQFDKNQCALLFETSETVELLHAALGAPDDVAISVSGECDLDEEVLDVIGVLFGKIEA